ncbi:hypothetical protein, variant [Fonticula alba]|uniref:Uncharacterized protein n=1 Tax=Fonticula alba TaxID=691883 RepID=A0A058ZGH7_FONAL|nr:hypothetical protein, variant [Fonticula alba]KCV73033.1 hypothetical protein, variant [Fonticula alba]|eukprot:XP_009492734.1 hypothetical protein, variant [Fonticula alba]
MDPHHPDPGGVPLDDGADLQLALQDICDTSDSDFDSESELGDSQTRSGQGAGPAEDPVTRLSSLMVNLLEKARSALEENDLTDQPSPLDLFSPGPPGPGAGRLGDVGLATSSPMTGPRGDPLMSPSLGSGAGRLGGSGGAYTHLSNDSLPFLTDVQPIGIPNGVDPSELLFDLSAIDSDIFNLIVQQGIPLTPKKALAMFARSYRASKLESEYLRSLLTAVLFAPPDLPHEPLTTEALARLLGAPVRSDACQCPCLCGLGPVQPVQLVADLVDLDGPLLADQATAVRSRAGSMLPFSTPAAVPAPGLSAPVPGPASGSDSSSSLVSTPAPAPAPAPAPDLLPTNQDKAPNRSQEDPPSSPESPRRPASDHEADYSASQHLTPMKRELLFSTQTPDPAAAAAPVTPATQPHPLSVQGRLSLFEILYSQPTTVGSSSRSEQLLLAASARLSALTAMLPGVQASAISEDHLFSAENLDSIFEAATGSSSSAGSSARPSPGLMPDATDLGSGASTPGRSPPVSDPNGLLSPPGASPSLATVNARARSMSSRSRSGTATARDRRRMTTTGAPPLPGATTVNWRAITETIQELFWLLSAAGCALHDETSMRRGLADENGARSPLPWSHPIV